MKIISKPCQFAGFLILAFLLIGSASYGQRPGRKAMNGRIESQQVAFITKNLQLTPEEAKVFWPVYEEFKQKKQQLNKDYREKSGKRMQERETLTEKEYKELADNLIIQEQRQLDLKKEYHTRFLSVLPSSKVYKLYETERQFKRMLLDGLKEGRNREMREK